MKQMNLIPVLWAMQKKIRNIFSCVWSILLFLGSQMFICFINLVLRSQNREYVRQFRVTYAYLMNLMNIYEVRVFKRELMNMKTCVTS
jgi:hypothetical protein